jgi:bifunctional NMN adenylyltransferase/nudix hydrolase
MEKTLVVVVAYFQNTNLTERDITYLNSICSKNGKTLAVLDVKKGACTAEQPLRPNQRQDILRGHNKLFDCGVKEQLHIRDNARWTAQLDHTIENALKVNKLDNVKLFVAQSLVEKYTGNYDVHVMEEIPGLTDVSAPLAVKPKSTNDFRQGVMYAEQRAFPLVYSTVDIALVNKQMNTILLGRKADEDNWRFPGGFVDPTDLSKEDAWLRELQEEVPNGVTNFLSEPQYVCTSIVPDCRYTGRDKIMTTMFGAIVEFSDNLQAGDDLVEVRLFEINSNLFNIITEDHHPVLEKFITWLDSKKLEQKNF